MIFNNQLVYPDRLHQSGQSRPAHLPLSTNQLITLMVSLSVFHSTSPISSSISGTSLPISSFISNTFQPISSLVSRIFSPMSSIASRTFSTNQLVCLSTNGKRQELPSTNLFVLGHSFSRFHFLVRSAWMDGVRFYLFLSVRI